MNIEILNIGTELTTGRVLNTHQQWLCSELFRAGYAVSRQTLVADEPQIMAAVFREALARSDVVIATGGLGPTTDDLTVETVAKLLGTKLVFDEPTFEEIKNFFEQRGRPVPDNARRQALVPESARALHNPNGTAPGIALLLQPNPFQPGADKSGLFLLPGPPRELRPMFTRQVLPWITREFPCDVVVACRNLRTTGLGESFVQNKIQEPLNALTEAGLEVGYCARPGEVDVRLTARGCGAEETVGEAERIVRSCLGEIIYGQETDSLEAVVVQLLASKKLTLALAESCTGGLIASRITDVPGASAVFLAGHVTYSNAAKETMLGVPAETIEQHGAGSEQTARAMAEGARQRTGADVALSGTGIAGPSGGSAEKPVGTVYISLAAQAGTTVEKCFNPYDRQTFKWVTAQQALDLLRRHLARVSNK